MRHEATCPKDMTSMSNLGGTVMSAGDSHTEEKILKLEGNLEVIYFFSSAYVIDEENEVQDAR